MAIRFQQIELAGTGNHLYPTIAATGSGQLVQIQSSHGYLQIGSNNTSYAHFQTDRPTFYFNKNIVVDGGFVSSYDENLSLVRANSNATLSLGEDSNATNDGWAVLKVGEKKGLFMQNGSNYLTKYLHSVRTDSASPTHTTYYQWYTIKNPAGYSNQGLASTFKVKIYTAGKHANGSTYSEYLIRCHNANNQDSGGMANAEVFCLLRTGYSDGYGGATQDVDFHYRTGLSGWNDGEIIFRLKRANREPVDVIKIEPIGADTSTDWMPTLVSHGGGTGANDNSPTVTMTAINMQYGGLHRTSSTDGRLIIDVNGKGSNTAHEIARFVNTNSASTSSYMYIGATSGTDWRLGKAVFGTGSNFTIAKHSGSTAAISINSSGNGYVGIGVNSASYPLEINGNVYSSTRFQGGNTLIGTSGGYACLGSNASSVPIAIARDFAPASYPDIIVDAAGHVGIGGTNVYGGTGVKSLNITASDYPLLAFYAGTTLRTQIISYSNKTYFGHANSSATWEFNNGNARASISSAGLLTVANDVVAFGSPSDISLKENIKPIESALDKVNKLKGVTFDWKESDSILDIKEDIGFIAQDVQEVLPELVRENDNGKLSLRDKGIVPVLVEAIKELKEEIEQLKKQINNG